VRADKSARRIGSHRIIIIIVMYPHHHIALGLLPGITSTAFRALVECGASFEEIASAPPEDLASLGLRRAAIEALAHPEPYLEHGREQVELCSRHDARFLLYRDPEFPPLLNEIYAPPNFLFVRGTLEPREEMIAVVGTRTASIYGRLAAERYAAEIARAGVAVASGLARGIDTVAHAAALDAGGRTVAVIASGLDCITPHAASLLASRIAHSGAVVSEYPFGTRALRPYFPQRNRIISGMARGTVVIESDERGGAMITAGFALDQNREVFAVPGPISSPQSRGTNLLIRTDRARLTQSPLDLLEALGLRVPVPPEQRGAAERPAEELTLFERTILDAVGDDPVHVDVIGEAAGLDASDVLVSLLTLEFKGMVRQMAGKMFVRT
jgi:DNA processing protein